MDSNQIQQQQQKPLSQTYNFSQQTSTTMQAMSKTQPIPQIQTPQFTAMTSQPISISPTINQPPITSQTPTKPKKKSKTKKRSKTSLKD